MFIFYVHVQYGLYRWFIQSIYWTSIRVSVVSIGVCWCNPVFGLQSRKKENAKWRAVWGLVSTRDIQPIYFFWTKQNTDIIFNPYVGILLLFLFFDNFSAKGKFTDERDLESCKQCPKAYYTNDIPSNDNVLRFFRCQGCPRGT